MAKKKNPEQEVPTAEPQEEQPLEQEETPAEEPTQDPQPQEQEPQEESEEEEPAEEEKDPQQDPAEDPKEEQPKNEEPSQQPVSDETEQLRSQLIQAQGRLAAYAAGVNSAMVDDAVTLAMAEASKAGTVTEASVTAAMEAVLKRHPEWKAAEGKKKTAGGFKIGADRDNGGTQKNPNPVQNIKRWNRFK